MQTLCYVEFVCPQIALIFTDFFLFCHSRGGGNPEGHFQPLKTRKYTEKAGSGLLAARELQRTANIKIALPEFFGFNLGGYGYNLNREYRR